MEDTAVKRIMPHNYEAEKAVLGSMIMDTEAIVKAAEIITKDDFYKPEHGLVFDTIVSMYNAGKDIDLVTLMDGLKAKDAPEEVMSFSFFNELTSIPTS
ncbi:MAG: replicative DNA helicase, partial [Lachnospiraceae bacterium]|nr:replicative DNA helicase [Lachnospiraceae bacterium]